MLMFSYSFIYRISEGLLFIKPMLLYRDSVTRDFLFSWICKTEMSSWVSFKQEFSSFMRIASSHCIRRKNIRTAFSYRKEIIRGNAVSFKSFLQVVKSHILSVNHPILQKVLVGVFQEENNGRKSTFLVIFIQLVIQHLLGNAFLCFS